MRRAVALIAFATACGPRLPDVPSAGGPAWHELATLHFTMWTDAPVERGREILQRMEWLRSIMYGVAFPDLPAGGQTFVVALRDSRESQVYTGNALAYSVPTEHNPLGFPMVVLPADASGDERVVNHETAHAISHNAIHHQPRWFAEGLATYFETLDIDTHRGRVDVGNVPPSVAQLLRVRGLLPMSDMLQCRSRECGDISRYYATAWAMYAYLHNKHPAEVSEFERALDHGGSAAPVSDLDALGLEVSAWLHDGDYTISSFTIEKRDWKVVDRLLSDADVYVVRAVLLVQQHRSKDVANNIAAALARDPTNVWARVLDVHALHHPLTEADARALTTAHPANFWSWLLLARVTTDDAKRDALAKACALILQNPALEAPASCAR